ncbi:class I SAM-dependent methyltransferase [Crossiella cryophila]|uniref:SAM-dependent methyltransferase n=1 Tax=Crossiella cryophila TaxID=43355 RepID=A0A7W7CE66_9PSEU|nr:class I SAM-dependent methyltransferase [Crossiella cryophila]MBB4678168.1 SAM-dependent methyltransferase [Crossiella cryophila]
MTYAPEWLALREPADAHARATDLLDPLRAALPARSPLVIRDLGCGTGSQCRWLSPRLDGPQHWILHDYDPRLLALAAADLTSADRTVETRLGDLTELRGADLAGADLVTASALLDLFTVEEVNGFAAAIVEAGVPALLTLSIAGRIVLDPADGLDAAFESAFNDHQRRTTNGRALLGPDAPAATTEAFEALGYRVHTRPSTWLLGPELPELSDEWLHGWVGAAVEQEPELAAAAPGYLRRRIAEGFRAEVHHVDQLALPGAD